MSLELLKLSFGEHVDSWHAVLTQRSEVIPALRSTGLEQTAQVLEEFGKAVTEAKSSWQTTKSLPDATHIDSLIAKFSALMTIEKEKMATVAAEEKKGRDRLVAQPSPPPSPRKRKVLEGQLTRAVREVKHSPRKKRKPPEKEELRQQTVQEGLLQYVVQDRPYLATLLTHPPLLQALHNTAQTVAALKECHDVYPKLTKKKPLSSFAFLPLLFCRNLALIRLDDAELLKAMTPLQRLFNEFRDFLFIKKGTAIITEDTKAKTFLGNFYKTYQEDFISWLFLTKQDELYLKSMDLLQDWASTHDAEVLSESSARLAIVAEQEVAQALECMRLYTHMQCDFTDSLFIPLLLSRDPQFSAAFPNLLHPPIAQLRELFQKFSYHMIFNNSKSKRKTELFTKKNEHDADFFESIYGEFKEAFINWLYTENLMATYSTAMNSLLAWTKHNNTTILTQCTRATETAERTLFIDKEVMRFTCELDREANHIRNALKAIQQPLASNHPMYAQYIARNPSFTTSLPKAVQQFQAVLAEAKLDASFTQFLASDESSDPLMRLVSSGQLSHWSKLRKTIEEKDKLPSLEFEIFFPEQIIKAGLQEAYIKSLQPLLALIAPVRQQNQPARRGSLKVDGDEEEEKVKIKEKKSDETPATTTGLTVTPVKPTLTLSTSLTQDQQDLQPTKSLTIVTDPDLLQETPSGLALPAGDLYLLQSPAPPVHDKKMPSPTTAARMLDFGGAVEEEKNKSAQERPGQDQPQQMHQAQPLIVNAAEQAVFEAMESPARVDLQIAENHEHPKAALEEQKAAPEELKVAEQQRPPAALLRSPPHSPARSPARVAWHPASPPRHLVRRPLSPAPARQIMRRPQRNIAAMPARQPLSPNNSAGQTYAGFILANAVFLTVVCAATLGWGLVAAGVVAAVWGLHLGIAYLVARQGNKSNNEPAVQQGANPQAFLAAPREANHGEQQALPAPAVAPEHRAELVV